MEISPRTTFLVYSIDSKILLMFSFCATTSILQATTMVKIQVKEKLSKSKDKQ